jgi:hypothetical protein
MLSTFAGVGAGSELLFYPKAVASSFPGPRRAVVVDKTRVRDPEALAAARALPRAMGFFAQVRPPCVDVADYPMVWKVRLRGPDAVAVARLAAGQAGLELPGGDVSSTPDPAGLWVEVPGRLSTGAVVEGSLFDAAYDRSAQLSADSVVYRNNTVRCRPGGSMRGIEVQCLPAWLEASFQLRNITIADNTFHGCGTDAAHTIDTSPLQCSWETPEGAVIESGNRFLSG